MKKLSSKILIVLMLVLQIPSITITTAYAMDVLKIPYQPPERSREELYQDIVISLLLPTIQKEVGQYYLNYLTQAPMVYPYTVYVMNARRADGYRSFRFDLKLRVDSYIGPHNSVGFDEMTITVGGAGEIEVKMFKHIESYKLPPNDENIIKKGYHNPIP